MKVMRFDFDAESQGEVLQFCDSQYVHSQWPGCVSVFVRDSSTVCVDFSPTHARQQSAPQRRRPAG